MFPARAEWVVDTRLATTLAMVGERLMSRAGCFGCHEVAGHEDDQPIGTELTPEGIKDLHQLDFGGVDKKLIPHTRVSFFRNKLTHPRVYDWAKVKYWPDKLRMPRFNFRWDDQEPVWPEPESEEEIEKAEARMPWVSTRGAVAAVVAGLVEEPIKAGAIFHPDEYQKDIVAGRRVVKRYGCNNCHTLEGQKGLLWHLRMEADPNTGDLPPNLFTQGWRTQSEWLLKFLKQPFDLRPIVNINMPRFGLNDEEATALVRYFIRLGGRDRNLITPNPDSILKGRSFVDPARYPGQMIKSEHDGSSIGPVHDAVTEARLLFDTINCNKCHLPLGTPGADPNDGGVAPSFELSSERLRQQWVRMLLNNPEHLISGTKMPSAYPARAEFGRETLPQYRAFQFHLRDEARWQALYRAGKGGDEEKLNEALTELAEVQMDALADYVIHHYRPPAPPTEPGGR